jgi:hypothetical protein
MLLTNSHKNLILIITKKVKNMKKELISQIVREIEVIISKISNEKDSVEKRLCKLYKIKDYSEANYASLPEELREEVIFLEKIWGGLNDTISIQNAIWYNLNK